MAAVPKTPEDWLHLFQQQANQLSDFLTGLRKKTGQGERHHSPPVDIYETATHCVVEFELPGFHRDDLSLQIIGNLLTLEGVKRDDPREQTVSFICLERDFGHFCRFVEIPPIVDLNTISARFNQGVLTVELRKLGNPATIAREVLIE